MAVGAICPKHDVKLDFDEPGPESHDRRDQAISWVTLSKFPDSLAVAAARIRLEAEGIPTFLEGERMGSSSMYQVATGGVKLQVPAELVGDARIILDQSWSLGSVNDEVDDDLGEVEYDWDETATQPDMTRFHIAEAIFVIVLIGPLIIWLLGRFYGHR